MVTDVSSANFIERHYKSAGRAAVYAEVITHKINDHSDKYQ